MATTNTTKKASDKPAKPQKQNKARVPDARPKLKAPAKAAGSKSSVIKRPFSLPVPLFKFAQAEAKRIGKEEGKRPNLSGYIAGLLFAAKHAAATPAK